MAQHRPPRALFGGRKSLRVGLAAAAALLLVTSLAAGQTRGAPPSAAPLAKFHDWLAKLETRQVPRVEILQIGDSHTAGDQFTGRLRQLFQQRFGKGSRGFIPPGIPHEHYAPQQIVVSQTGDWENTISSTAQAHTAIFGFTGMLARGRQPTGILSIEDRTGTRLSFVQVGVISRPDGGSADILVDGQPYDRLETKQPETRYAKTWLSIEGVGKRIALRPRGDGPVDLTEIGFFGAGRGVEVSNIGFPGAQAAVLDKWHWETVERQLADIGVGLVILAFGTNEGFAPADRIAATYARTFERQLRAVATAVPGASIAVVGPPDANRYPRYCLPPLPPEPVPPPVAPEQQPAGGIRDQAEQPTPTGPAPARTEVHAAKKASKPVKRPDPPADAICKPLGSDERPRYDALIDAKDGVLCRWHTPAAIPLVRRIQRDVAARNGAFFWDWSALLEGECGADRWARRGLASKDRVHFTSNGYALAAERFYTALVSGYVRPR